MTDTGNWWTSLYPMFTICIKAKGLHVFTLDAANIYKILQDSFYEVLSNFPNFMLNAAAGFFLPMRQSLFYF